MNGRIESQVTLAALAWLATAQGAAAQRPPSSSEPAKGAFSIDKMLDWLLARPGVLVAIALIVAALLYMYFTNRRPRT